MKQMVTVFQVKKDMTREFGFRRLDEMGAVIDMKPYEVVFGEKNVDGYTMFYTKDKSDKALLELFFHLTNSPHPGDVQAREVLRNYFGFKGRSISVGDIIKINGKFYYCDSFGWQEVEVKNVPHWIYVGMGASGTYFSDWTPYEVIKISESGKTITLRQMDWKITKGSEQDGSAEYEYFSNPEGEVITARESKSRGWRTPNNMYIAFGSARRYYDPSF